jgi:diguanylate cyclase (GGDEF)-like protein
LAIVLLQSVASFAAGGASARAPEAVDFAFVDPYFQSIGDSDAIPSGVVTALAQDGRGLLWIGTEEGLIRYDGYRFRRYNHVRNDPHSLAGDYIATLFVDPDGHLWIGTGSDGISRFDGRTEQFENFQHDASRADSIGRGMIWSVACDNDGRIWAATDSGLDYLPRGQSTWRHFRHADADPNSLMSDRVHNLLLDRRGALWVGTSMGLQRLRPDLSGFDRLVVDPATAAPSADDKLPAANDVRALFEAADGKIWVGTRKRGAAWMAPGELTPHWLPVDPARADGLSHGWVRTISQPQDGQIWLGTYGGGLDIVRADDGKVEKKLHHDLSIASSLALDGVGAMLKDRAGQLWVGTWGGGLQHYNPQNQAIRVLRHSPLRPEGLSQAEVDSVLELADGRLLVGTDGNGIDILDRQKGVVGGYRPQAGKRGALADAAIFGLAKTHDGALWAGTKQAGAMRLLPGATDWEGFGVAQGLPAIGVATLKASREGELWVGTDSGLAHWQDATQRFETYAGPDGQAMHAHVYSLEQDAQGRIWAGSDNGLWVKEPNERFIHAIHHAQQDADSLSSDDIAGLLIDRKGQLWVSTAQGFDRLLSWDGQRARFEHLSTALGFPGLSLGDGPLEDSQGRIWTDRFVIDPKRLTLTTLSKADGLEIGTNWDASYGRTHDNFFLYGGTLGLAIIDPEKFRPWDYQPPVVVTELKVNGRHVPLATLEGGLTLTPEQRDFSVEFAALDYTAPNKNRYAYRLQGYDGKWIETDAENRSASYGNLWPGRYTLQVRGSNRAGAWSPHELSIPVIVLPAFWQTGWFLAFALLFAGALIYAAIRRRVVHLQAQAESLRNVVAQRTQELVEKNRELEQLAITDRLTGLYNRLYLDRALQHEMAVAQRTGEAFSLVMLDIDKFKMVNDRYGHQAGDEALVTLAGILQSRMRVTDVAGRWGGEEFLVICPATDRQGAQGVAETLRSMVEQTEFSRVGHCTASFGVASFEADDSITTIVARADRALYAAKEGGRNRVVVA